MLLSVLGPLAQAQRLPLPPDEQDAVNSAIDRGVRYLKGSQGKNGTWSKKAKEPPVGYAALPGLTLLECGVPPSDPLIQNTAKFLRSKAATLYGTYELSLGILFLDRLGDPKDEKIIQTFALRLVAGQSTTGGWGYRCPSLPPTVEKELLTALRFLNPHPEGMPEIAHRGPGAMPKVAGRDPAKMPGIAAKPGDLGPTTQKPAGPPIGGTTTPTRPPLSGTVTPSGSDSSLSPRQSTTTDGNGSTPTSSDSGSFVDLPDPKPDKKDAKGPHSPASPPQPEPKDAKPDNEPANAKPADAKPGDGKPAAAKPAPPPKKADKPYVIPERLLMFPVMQDPALHLVQGLQDPLGKRQALFLTTTDNSNTQFAILALWTAQRHGVPMERTLRLVVRRFMTSQNADGSWGYDYRFGGGTFRGPAMTCVGLIGLAAGHGLARPDRPAGAPPVQDPQILNGLAALSRSIGKPAERTIDLPLQDLYYLWSLERTAVLYNLPTIGDKDWYRWGAQILVANQRDGGNWTEGGYHGHSPLIDTCLALLFLKRANLVKDLTAKLPFNPDDLNKSIMRILEPPPPSKPTERITKTAEPEPAKPAAPPEDATSKEPDAPKDTPRAAEPDPTPPNTGNGKIIGAVLFLVLFLILAGGSAYFFLAAAGQKKSKEKDKKLKGPKGKRKLKSATPAPDTGT